MLLLNVRLCLCILFARCICIYIYFVFFNFSFCPAPTQNKNQHNTKNLKNSKSKMDDRDFRYLDRSSMAQSTRGSSVPNEDMQNYLGDTTPGSPVFEKMDSVFETNYASAPPVQVKHECEHPRVSLRPRKFTFKTYTI